MNVAQTILQQLGGNKFAAMTGARNFMADGAALRFALPSNFARGGINRVAVRLEVTDLYTVEFHKVRGTKVQKIAERADVYADQLRDIFTATTGLDCSL